MDRRTYLKHALVLSGGLLFPAGVVSLVGRRGVTNSTDLTGFDGKIMGTTYSVRLRKPSDELHTPDQLIELSVEQLAQGVHTTLLDVDRRMSTWRDASELSLFNNSSEVDWHKFSPATFGVIDNSVQISKLSSGAFDVSVGPLINLWGFGANIKNTHSESDFNKPSATTVTDCMRYVGYNAIEIDHTQGTIRKLIPEAKLDLSGIAKGFAVDQVAKCLDAHGLDNYLVEVGGELRSKGFRSKNQKWRVAIERPNVVTPDVLRVLNLHNRAIATSGDYRNFFVDGGKRYSHSIDPRIGRPVNHELVSVSVIAKTTMLADALSTALIILGPDEAHSFAERHQVAAHFILKSATGNLEEQFSPHFNDYIT